ncbi:Metalloenzyme, LuxS/M16 peptidase-like protein [Lobosporangium transversale]|uniref:Presequence protease, mitochondrial n=1 Tax=Lobosporangium transversale TaxID=64571 RepID=A0A1Y2GI88_9FUNG|nr:Metalloenzyme, LuxS/M16 peptidase-like protein [Lobosporangium transversale]ORZ11722.1 Metalloenzyme, LuxS/M16 peptidase-like protein [Lobosporangium transversale]|eukprot:XP_021879819.1 Metalloenzyme, LuxS/M16 peptidase-like protein [Lobosporangium transversale]
MLAAAKTGLATLSTSETWKPGKTLCGYKVLETRHIKELELDAIRLRHEKTGAEHLHISRDDSKTTGVPHILEHTTLCGSRSFPVRDPFFKMLNRSMATFMNAFTASDYTLYPFSTTNPIDYKNLRDVYMDAAFFPHLRELDFKQEGWRLEHEDPNELVRFHKTHYHPSNAKFYSYGNFRLEDTLEAINSKLHEFSPITPPVVDKVVKPFESPRRINLTCPVDPMTPPEKQAKMSDTFEGFGLRILSDLLTDGHASPMYKALIESDLGSEYSSNTGYDGSTMMSSLSFGVQGMKVENVPKVEQTIIAVLEKVREEGVDPKRVEAIVHQMELGQKHQGLSSGWFNGCNPLDLLELNKNIDRLKSEFHLYLLNNPHKLVFTMVPSTDYGAEVAANEMTRLMGKTSVLTKADKEAIYEQGQALLKNQEKIEDVSCLPTLKVDDISKKTKIFSLEHSAVNSVPVQWRPTSTNGITYFRGSKYLPLFADSLTSLGTHKRAMSEIDDEIRLHTGGVRVAPFLSTNHSTIDRTEEGLSFSSYCLDKQESETNFDNTDKLRTLIKGYVSVYQREICSSFALNLIRSTSIVFVECFGSLQFRCRLWTCFARTNAGSRLTPAGYASEIYGGMTQVQFMNSLAQMDDLTEVSQRLKEIANVAIKRSSLRLAVTCGDDQMSSNEKVIGQFISRLDASPVKSFSQLEFSPSYENSFFGLPYGINSLQNACADGAKLQILASLMSNLFLHREIREKNGAYGGGAGYSSTGGLFHSILITLSTYEDSVRWVLDRKDFSDQEMAEAKLSIFQRMDTPVSAAEEGMIIFSEGITDEMRQNRREQLLKVTSDDVKEVANRYLLNQPSSHCILGDEE